MRVLRVLFFTSAALAGLLNSASAAVLIPVPAVPNSTATTLFGINDDNVIAGSFIGSNDRIEHSFFGSLDGNYTTFDVGTGGSEGVKYLSSTLEKRFFPDLWNMRTLLG